jgi:Skp family chaperone for outer membrane proteins
MTALNTTLRAGVLASVASLALCVCAPAFAQSSPGWFVPKQAAAPASQPEAAHHARHAASPAPEPPASEMAGGPDAQAPQGPPPVLPLPPVPAVNALPKAPAPPAAVIGVISVPDIMHASSAAEQVQRVLGARRDKLTSDVQREQLVWRDLQTSIEEGRNQTQDQARAKLRSLQERVLREQQDFKNRQRVIQEAAQVALGQIERELVQVIRQVAASRGMNLVLHQEQVALNIQPFDISQQVVNQLNSVLPSVFIPADGVDPEQLAKDGTFPTTAQPPAPDATPVQVSAHAAGAPAPAPAPTKGK